MTRKTLFLVSLILMTLTVVIAGCSRDEMTPQAPALAEETLNKSQDGVPNEAEIEDLNLIREDEKLARDVYLLLNDQYDLAVFANIAVSEQRHMDAIKNLLDKYELPDPCEGNGPGEFTNEELQHLYDDLIAEGQASITGAMLVGLAIEEIDILDLQHAMDTAVLSDLDRVYGNLCDGSCSHLRAFVSNYESLTGETYVPRWLSQAAYDEIIGEDSDNGGHRKRPNTSS